MKYRLFARAAFWLHCVLSLWVFAGVPVELFFPRYVPGHVFFLGAILFCQWAYGWRCPLTSFEKEMLAKCAPDEVYEGAFLRHYMKRYFDVTIPPKRIAQTTVAILVGSMLLWGIEMFAGR